MFKYILFLCFLIQTSLFSFYQNDGWYFTTSLGASSSFHSNLSIYLDDESDLNQNAKWQGRPFEDSMYYAIRFDNISKSKGFGIEWIHHKIYLANPVSPLQSFSISDGFNLLYFNKLRIKDKVAYRYGLGLVFAHMDVNISGRDRFYLNGGFGGSYLSGVSTQFAIEKWIWHNEKRFLNLETKFTASYLRPPVSTDKSEIAVLNNFAIHFTFGLGSKPNKSKEISLKDRFSYFSFPFAYHLFAQFYSFK